MSRLTPWKPRASQIGGYFACSYRAAADRLVHDELMEAPEGCGGTNGYAAFGSLCHRAWQDALGAVRETEDDAERRAEDDAAALAHFKGDAAALAAAISAVTALAVANTPVLPEGVKWRAEVKCKSKNMTGHIDLLSSDGRIVVDLKTTSRKPDHQKAKSTHLYQMAAYRVMLPAPPVTGVLLYVDSAKAAWCLPSTIDYASEPQAELAEHVSQHAAYMRTAAFLRSARPNLGSHCTSGFCPYAAMCRDKYTPPAGDLILPKRLSLPTHEEPLL